MSNSRSGLSGVDAVFRGSTDYEERRRKLSWNPMAPAGYPEVIARVGDVGEVEKAVRFAAEEGRVVTVRSGGHSHIGSSVRDDAVLIDTSALKSIELNRDAATAKVGPGVQSMELAVELSLHGFGFPVGHCGTVAMGGYLLGGGHGINWGQWGPACYSVAALDVVDMTGSVRHISDETDPELMWLARGCGPSFPGVVTAYHLNLKPFPTSVRSSMLVFPVDDTATVTSWFAEQSFPPTVETGGALAGSLFDPDAPADGRYVHLFGLAYGDDPAATEAALQPFRETPLEPALATHATPMDLADLFAFTDLLLPPEGARIHADSAWSNAGIDRVFGALADHLKVSPSPSTNVLCYPPPDMPLQDNACFSMMTTNCVTLYGVHESEEDDARSVEWIAEGMELLEPITAGYWVNETDLTADRSRARRSFSPTAWDRIRQVRARHDPDGLFADYPGSTS